MSQRLTHDLVKNATAPDKGQRILFDADSAKEKRVKGFGVRITAGGAKSFVVDYRIDGRQRRYTIGTFPAWSVSAAREEAKKVRQRIDKGEDPMGERHGRKEAPTVKQLAEEYEKEYLPRKRPGGQLADRNMINRHIKKKPLGRMKVADVKHRDIQKIHAAMEKTPYHANRFMALLSKMFSLAVQWEYRPDNPVKGLEKYPEEGRKRYLSGAELTRLTDTLSTCEDQTAANVVRLCLLTGCRVGEALSATWDQFDTENGIWVKPSAHTKQKREHRVPLSAPALELLASIPRDDEQVEEGKQPVFPGRRKGEPLTTIKKPWEAIRKAAKLEDVRLHDLRHTYAALLASSGLSLPIIGALLGHTQPNTTARYAHLMDNPLREATERVGAIVAGGAKAKVGKLRA